jgi:hypothetical protein
MKYYFRIFNQNIEFRLPKNEELNRAFIEQFSLYQPEENNIPSIIIDLIDKPVNVVTGMRNPSIHNDLKNGFNMVARDGNVSFEHENGILHITAYIRFEKLSIIKFLKKVLNWEYTSKEEKIGQIIFERLLVPATFFFPEYFPIHSSAFLSPNNKIALIGGTGGVGKTSAEIELCLNRNYKFLCDDIAILDSKGDLFPNYAFPKIYGYNLVENIRMKNLIFRNRSFIDKLSWRLHQSIFGLAKVRRKIDPSITYSIPQGEKFLVNSFFTLVREFRSDFKTTNISSETATQLNLNVIRTEYAQFFNHIYWHMFNKKAEGRSLPVINNEALFLQMNQTSIKALENVNCYLIKAPIQINHQEFVQELCDIIEKNLKS